MAQTHLVSFIHTIICLSNQRAGLRQKGEKRMKTSICQ
uniref:Uncharacterized protein n=1 Tax=Rhizophora mucronata TaxID=61149 RepID=A0A2P2QV59_RHIMU